MRLPAALFVTTVLWDRLLRHLGGFGLILLGVLGPVIPLPGSLDALTIVLAARHRELWLYYAVMASVGALIGSQITYELARGSGRQALERRLSPQTAARLSCQVERWGFGTVVVSGLIPPPIPTFPVLLAAGAMRYPRKKFVLSLTVGRGVRYFGIALLAAVYGRRIFAHLAHSRGLLLSVAALTGVLMILAFVTARHYFSWRPPAARAPSATNSKREIPFN